MIHYEYSKLDYPFVLEEVPELYQDHFLKYLDRAIALLKLEKHHIHVLNEAYEELTRTIQREFSNYYLNSNEPESLKNQFISTPELLYRNLGILKSLNSNLKDSQYFGILGLQGIASALDIEGYALLPLKHSSQDWGLEDEVLSCLNFTIEAVCFGETLTHENTLFSEKLKSALSQRARKGSDARHGPTRKIKNEFIKYFYKHSTDGSKSKIAKQFYSELEQKKQRLLCPTLIESNAVRTLLDYLRAIEKTVTPPN